MIGMYAHAWEKRKAHSKKQGFLHARWQTAPPEKNIAGGAHKVRLRGPGNATSTLVDEAGGGGGWRECTIAYGTKRAT